MTKRVSFQRLKPDSVLEREAAESLTIAGCFSTSSCLLGAGDDLLVPQCVADKEEDGTDSCVDCWPHSEIKVQCKSKKKKRKAQSFCSSQVSEWNDSLAAFGSESFNRLAAFPTGNERGRLHTTLEHVVPPLAAIAPVPNQRRLVLVFAMWPHS